MNLLLNLYDYVLKKFLKKYPRITYNLLKRNKACDAQLALVKKHFGLKPIPLTHEVIVKYGCLFNINWAVRTLLTDTDRDEYYKNINDVSFQYMDDKCTADFYQKAKADEFVRLYAEKSNQ